MLRRDCLVAHPLEEEMVVVDWSKLRAGAKTKRAQRRAFDTRRGLVARRFRKARRRRLGINYATLTKLACPSLRIRLSDLIAIATSVTRRASSRDFKVSPMTRL